MKIKEGFILREVAGQSVVVAIGSASKKFKGVINLNETGALLFKTLKNDVSKEELIKVLMNEYDVEETIAKEDVEYFVKSLKDAGLIDE